MLANVTHILPLVNIRRARMLPVSGKVLVRAGQGIGASDVIAEAETPGKHIMIDIRRALGISRGDSKERLTQRRVGEKLQAGDVIAETGGLFRRVVRAPADGIVVNITAGKVLIETQGASLQLQAGLSGTVAEVIPEKGAIIETDGVLVQGVWGNQKINAGMLLALAQNPDEELLASKLDVSMRGAVILGGFCAEAKALQMAGDLQLRGLILGSLKPELIEIASKLPFPVLLVDGFGKRPMNPVAHRVLATNEKRDIAVNAMAWNAITGERPEAVISLPAQGGDVREVSAFKVGQTVRVRTQPYLGKIGQLSALRPGLTRLSNGLHVQAAVVQMDEIQAVIPLVNLDVIE